MLETGKVINGIYQVIEPVGEGGAGQVFLAWHNNLKKNVVIKRIKDNYVGRINERGEADILKKLHHRYLPQVYDFIQMDSEIYTVIDYIDGNTLMDYIDARVRFDEFQIVKWLRQLCEALDYLHTQTPPIIHSDIKPSNIMIDAKGDICLIDFNISFDEDDLKKISGYTAGYASPEQILKAQMYTTGGNYADVKLDAKSDIFSLGASIYHIMTLQNLIKAFNENKSLWDVAVPMPYSSLLIEIVSKTLKRDAKERYQTAGEMLADLESMKIRDERYRRLNRRQYIYNAVFIIMIAAGGLLMVKGTALRNAEAFDADYERVVGEAGLDDYDSTITDAIDLLNNGKYASVFKNRKKEQADLYYLIANSYFEMDDYETAIRFYEETLAVDDSNPEYYRDYSITYARTGNIDTAEAIATKAIEKGISDADLHLIKAEISNAKGEWDDAIQEFGEVIRTTDNENTLGRAYLLMSRAYRSKGELLGSREGLTDALNKVNDTWRIRLLREKGAVCIQYIEENGNSDEWLKEAEDCYKSLTNSGRCTMNDWLNYSLIMKKQEFDKDAVSILRKAEELFPDTHRLLARQALYEIQAQSKLPEADRNYKKVEECYRKAEEKYKKAKNAGDSDDEMQQLEQLMQDIYEKGWL